MIEFDGPQLEGKTWVESPKEPMGYSLLGERKCECPTCKVELLKVVVVKESDKIHQIQALCPFCHQLTFITEVKGDIYLGTDDFMFINNIDTTQDNNTFKYKVEVLNVK